MQAVRSAPYAGLCSKERNIVWAPCFVLTSLWKAAYRQHEALVRAVRHAPCLVPVLHGLVAFTPVEELK